MKTAMFLIFVGWSTQAFAQDSTPEALKTFRNLLAFKVDYSFKGSDFDSIRKMESEQREYAIYCYYLYPSPAFRRPGTEDSAEILSNRSVAVSRLGSLEMPQEGPANIKEDYALTSSVFNDDCKLVRDFVESNKSVDFVQISDGLFWYRTMGASYEGVNDSVRGNPLVKLDAESLAAIAQNTFRVDLESDPTEATVTVKRFSGYTKTDNSIYLPKGDYEITFKKGALGAIENLRVNGNTPLKAILK